MVHALVVQLATVIHIKTATPNSRSKKQARKEEREKKKKVIIFVNQEPSLAHSVFYQEPSTEEFCLNVWRKESRHPVEK